MGREASAISISPRQNASKPPPVPEKATLTRTSETLLNSSATASEIGKTVDEPSTRIFAGQRAVVGPGILGGRGGCAAAGVFLIVAASR